MNDSDFLSFPISHSATVLPFEANPDEPKGVGKPLRKTTPLTFGRCVAAVCDAYGLDRAEGFLRFAVNSGIVVFPERRPVEIAPRDPRMEGRPNLHQATGLIRYFLPDGRDNRPAAPRSPFFRAPAAETFPRPIHAGFRPVMDPRDGLLAAV